MASESRKKASRSGQQDPPPEGVDVPPSRSPARSRETAIIAGLAVLWLLYVFWSTLSERRGGTATPTSGPSPVASASAAASTAPVAGVDADTDLFAHDVVAALIVFQREGPAELRATKEQRDLLTALWPDVKKNLENNSTHPSAVDAKMRAILTPAQKEGIRKLAAAGQLTLPAHLKTYVPQFERLLSGAPLGAASGEPSATASASPAASGAPSPGPAASGSPVSVGSPASSASAAPISGRNDPGSVEDPYLDLFLHDMIGGTIALQEEGPAALRLTPSQREALTALLPQIQKRLQANDPKPSALDDQVRKILTSPQKAEIRTLISGGKVHLPPKLSEYVQPFEQLLQGKYVKGAFHAAASPAPGIPSGAPAGLPSGAPAPGQGTASPAAEPFDDIFLHDAIGGLIVIERDGPAPLKLTAEQRGELEKLWPEIRKRLEGNDWKSGTLDAQVVRILTPKQREALRALRGSGKLALPPKLNTYIEPFSKILKKP